MLSTTYINNFESILLLSGVMLTHQKETNIRIFVCLEKGSFVAFRIFVPGLLISLQKHLLNGDRSS